MALTDAGRRLLRHGVQQDLFEELVRRDPTSAQGLLPWDGQNPRDLTDSGIRFRLGHEGASLNAEDAALEEMCRRHQHGW